MVSCGGRRCGAGCPLRAHECPGRRARIPQERLDRRWEHLQPRVRTRPDRRQQRWPGHVHHPGAARTSTPAWPRTLYRLGRRRVRVRAQPDRAALAGRSRYARMNAVASQSTEKTSSSVRSPSGLPLHGLLSAAGSPATPGDSKNHAFGGFPRRRWLLRWRRRTTWGGGLVTPPSFEEVAPL
jgi:hypothetical protein